jgi:16S rRNA (guanine1516-N2)-methyltransferase
MSNLAVVATSPGLEESARLLASSLDLPFLEDPAAASCDALVELGEFGLRIQSLGRDAPGPVAVDFAAGAMRHRRRGGQNEPLGRAVGVGKRERLQVVDATAGLGRDSFVLADLGCEVTMVERSPVVYALLEDGLRRALRSDDCWLTAAAGRLRLEAGEAVSYLAAMGEKAPEVVYLDPMFPERKKSARVKKEMWLFQSLLDDDPNEMELLEQALRTATYRVVVKRPARAAPLVNRKPSFQLPGKAVRFDVYTPRQSD